MSETNGTCPDDGAGRVVHLFVIGQPRCQCGKEGAPPFWNSNDARGLPVVPGHWMRDDHGVNHFMPARYEGL